MLDLANNISGLQAGGGPLSGPAEANDLDKDAFLKLLVAQLNNQDPLSPMKNEEFIAQLAQFSSLEQMQQINSNLSQSIDADFLLNQAMNNSLVTTLIGKDVIALSDTIIVDENSMTQPGFRLDASAKKVSIRIYDETGTLVRTLQMDGAAAGEQKIEWDGLDAEGKKVPPGEYRFEVSAKSAADDTSLDVTTFVRGTITGVRYEQGKAFLLMGNSELELGDVERILQPDEE